MGDGSYELLGGSDDKAYTKGISKKTRKDKVYPFHMIVHACIRKDYGIDKVTKVWRN